MELFFCTSLASSTNPHGYLTPLHHSQSKPPKPKPKHLSLPMNSLLLRTTKLLPLRYFSSSSAAKPKTPNTYTITTQRFTPSTTSQPKKSTLPRPTEVPFQAKVANSVRLVGHVTTPLHVHTSPDGTFWASTVLTALSKFKSLRVPVIFEGDLAHIASLHVKESDTVFVAGSLRSDLSHLNASDGGETSLQVKVDTLNFVEESYPMKKITKDASEEMTLDFTVPNEKDDMNKSSKDILAKPHEWLDVRSKEGSRKAFKRKSNDELRVLNDSTPEWIQHQLGSLKFDQKPISHGSETILGTDEATTSGTWRDLLDNPKQWKDYRDLKLNKLVKKNHPDFKHKDGGHALWLDKVPQWVLSELEGLEFDVPIQMSKQEKERRGDKAWKDLVENPTKWWDNRLDKRSPKYPDFKNKETGEALWLSSSPEWALPMLPPSKTQHKATTEDRDMSFA